MSIKIQQVLDYLDAHAISRQADSVETLLGMLHDIYAMHNRLNSAEVRRLFQQMRSSLSCLSETEYDELFTLVCSLCVEHEQQAFAQGVLAGMQLYTEINALP